MKKYTIKQLADLAEISVRTLHYYDEVGLLRPTEVGKNGYRYYSENELLKLQQILFYRELEFSLEEIKKIMSDKKYQMIDSLKDQEKLLQSKKIRLNKLLKTISLTIENMSKKKKITDKDLYGSFSKKQYLEYKEEAKQKYGSKIVEESEQRLRTLSKDELEAVKKEGEDIVAEIAKNMAKGPKNPEIQALIARYHKYMNHFYECSTEMFRGLGKMYVEDIRFTAYYEKRAVGLAQFMHEAIECYCNKRAAL